MYVVYDKNKQKVPIYSWVPENKIEPDCLVQLQNVSNLPFVHKHVSCMPDVHLGNGTPIGCVYGSKDYVVIGSVGVDIGCGMRYLQTDIKWQDIKDIKNNDGQEIRKVILSTIMRNIPVGFNHHKTPQNEWLTVAGGITDVAAIESTTIIAREYEKSLYQLGTLGGGNHFIELQQDELGRVAIMIHSGSRNLGKQVCDHYNKLARDINKLYFSSIPDNQELAFLPIASKEGIAYLAEMQLCLDFAYKNRELMMERAKNVFLNILEKYGNIKGITILKNIDVHHNYATMENHFGENVLVHRKGAVRARRTDNVIIPGSMGTASYVGYGLENQDSFNSCSHGSGRTMGRKEALRQFSAQHVMESMAKLDIVLLKPNKDDVAEECAEAYKDIEDVINNEKDLVEVTTRLTPLGVIKG